MQENAPRSPTIRINMFRARFTQKMTEAERLERYKDVAFSLSIRAHAALEQVIGSHPTIPEIQRFIESAPGWRAELRRLRNCGRKTVDEIERFAAGNGIDVSRK